MVTATIAIGAPIIEAQNVSKTYRSDGNTVAALRDVSLTVRKGEMVAVMGPSGCGKTTLLNTLSGLDSIDEGEIRIEGQEIEPPSGAPRLGADTDAVLGSVLGLDHAELDRLRTARII